MCNIQVATYEWRNSQTKLTSLDNAWTVTFSMAVCYPDMPIVLQLLESAEEGLMAFGGSKRLTRLLIDKLLAFKNPSRSSSKRKNKSQSQTNNENEKGQGHSVISREESSTTSQGDTENGTDLPAVARNVIQYCQIKDYPSLAFDLALTSNNFDLGLKTLKEMEAKGEDHVMMLVDIAAQVSHTCTLIF